MKKTLLILFAIIFAINLNTQAEDFSAIYNGKIIYYNITSTASPRTVAVTYLGSTYYSYSNEYSGVVSIPDSVLYSGNYYKVTSIGNYAFYNCSGLTSITIPNTVTSIGSSAFESCEGLTSISIPNLVTSIGGYAFAHCEGLTSITIPDSVTSINNYTFYECTGITSLTIGNSVTSIGVNAFRHIYQITSVIVPNSVTSIGSHAFNNCSGLTSITIGNSVTSIGDYAFSSCTGLTSIKCLAVNPPNITPITFYNINKSIPLYVPCNSMSSYQSASYWSEFTNHVSFKIAQFVTDTVCSNQTYTNYGANINNPGNYILVNGCDSVVLTLRVSPIYIDTIFAEICNNDTYTLNGFNASTAGFYTQNLQTTKGCDSIVNLSLVVNPIYNDTILAEIFSNEVYTLNGFNVNTAGFYTQNLQTIKGCDSVVNLSLFVNPIYLVNHYDTICKEQIYNNYGFNFIADTSGLYTQNLQTIKGYDSIINLYLIVNPIYNYTIQAEICSNEVYTLNGFNTNTAGFYTQNLQTIKGCDSIVNLSLLVNPIYNDTIIAEICSNEIYTLNGFYVNTAGFYTQNLQTTKGCDSVVNLSLLVNPIYNDTIIAEICQGETYSQFGFNENITGFYTQNLLTTKGCDSTVNLTLIINQPAITNLTAEICQGKVYTLNGFNASTVGLHTLNLQTYKGCDSIVNLTLTINQPAITNLIAEICQGETYTLNGFNVNTAGLHTLNLQTYKGCDSIVNLTLTINQLAITNLTAEICQGEVYTLNGFNISTAGLHTQNLQTIKGCDSTVNLTLTVNQPAITNFTAEICQGEVYTLNGFNVSTAGLHTLNLQTTKGCDSTVNLTLTVNQPAITNLTAEICQGEVYTLNGFNVSTAGLHTQNLQTIKGCDSIVNLSLVVNPISLTTYYDTICQGNIYNGYGFSFTADTTGRYTRNMQTINGCDSLIALYLTVKPTPIIPEGLDVQVRTNFIELNWQDNGSSYVIYRNNDSLTTTTMPIYLDYDVVNEQPYCYKVKSINGECESAFTNMICKTYLGIDNIQTNNITTKLYPNPTEGKVKLEIEGLTTEVDILVYDMVGRVVQRHSLNKGTTELDIDLSGYAKGVYSIRIMNDRINQTKKLIVQ